MGAVHAGLFCRRSTGFCRCAAVPAGISVGDPPSHTLPVHGRPVRQLLQFLLHGYRSLFVFVAGSRVLPARASLAKASRSMAVRLLAVFLITSNAAFSARRSYRPAARMERRVADPRARPGVPDAGGHQRLDRDGLQLSLWDAPVLQDLWYLHSIFFELLPASKLCRTILKSWVWRIPTTIRGHACLLRGLRDAGSAVRGRFRAEGSICPYRMVLPEASHQSFRGHRLPVGYAGRQRPRVGNFDRRTGFPDVTESRTFALWSGLKARLFSEHGVRYLLYALALALSVTAFAIARRGSLPAAMPEAVGALVAMTLIELLVASLPMRWIRAALFPV